MPVFSQSLEDAIHRSMDLAEARRHDLVTTEHLLLALIDERNAAAVMQACGVHLGRLWDALIAHVDADVTGMVVQLSPGDVTPTRAFQRVVRPRTIQDDGPLPTEIRGRDVLLALFAERDSPAVALLEQHGMTRDATVEAIAHASGDAPARDQIQARDAPSCANQDPAFDGPTDAEIELLLQRLTDRELTDLLRHALGAPPNP